MLKLKYSIKFYLGIILVIFSLIIGKITVATFILYFNSEMIKLLSVIIYILTWPMLLLGAWWVGEEYVKALKKYFTYQFYQKSLTDNTRKAINTTRNKTREFHSSIRNRFKKKVKPIN